MKHAAAPILGWAAFLTFLTAVLLLWTPDAELQWGPFAVAAGATWAIGAFALVRRRSVSSRLTSGRSGAALLLAIGAALAANGLVFGWWLGAVGVGVAVLSCGLYLRERR